MAIWFQPNWLLLLLCGIVLLLVSCTLLPHRTAPEPTAAYIPITFTPDYFAVLTPPPNSPEHLPILHQWIIPQAQNLITEPPPQQLRIDAPVCFPDMIGSQLCLGRVWNGSAHVITHLSLDITSTSTQTITLEQRSIAPETFAPYHFYLPTDEHITSLDLHQTTPLDLRLIPLTVTTSRGFSVPSGRFIITGTLENTFVTRLDAIRITGTVVNEWGEVVGYRTQDVSFALEVGESGAIRMEITPQVITSGLSFTLHADGIYKAP